MTRRPRLRFVGQSQRSVDTSADTKRPWRLVGFDTFSGDTYPLSEHDTELECYRAAREQLEELERRQPTEVSGGQDGIQDWVFVVTPTGSYIRYRIRT